MQKRKQDETTHGAQLINFLDENQCKAVIRYSKFLEQHRGSVQKKDSTRTEETASIRDVVVYPLNSISKSYSSSFFPDRPAFEKGRKLYDEIQKNLMTIIKEQNDIFNYKIDGLCESPQLLEYEAPSHGYDWHTDIGNGEASLRKLSVSIFLNEDYQGGEFCFFDRGERPIKPLTGQALIFSSFCPHRVKPVTKGTRWSLVAWVSGPCFK